MRAFVVGLIGSISCAVVLSAAELPTFPENSSYVTARGTLTSSGWKPAVVADIKPSCSQTDERCKWPETYSCASTGAAVCLYKWTRDDMVIAVQTHGGDPQVIDRIFCEAKCR